MFINSTHLPQILTAEQYTSDEQHEQEMSRLFRPAWHYVGTIADAPRDGDFFTVTLLGQPLIIWNRSGGFQTFLNVCPHRFSLITEAKCGHAGDRLRCRYHGWEFDETGNTRKIPDARSFRPLAPGELGLKKYRTETVGQLIFMTFQDDGPSLREWFGEVGWDIAETWCGENRRNASSLEMAFDANWKIKVENSIESYHLDMVHVGTFGRTPDPEVCRHVLDDRYTQYSTWEKAPTPMKARLDRLVHRLAHTEPDEEYKQFLFYPHIMFGKLRLFSWIEMVIPLSPTRSLNVAKLFSHKSTSGSLKGRLLCWALGEWGRRFTTRVAMEDFAVITEVQKGHNSGAQPSRGLVSVREERCFHFQDWVKRHTSPTEPRLAEDVA
jgi:choline monooxygenase